MATILGIETSCDETAVAIYCSEKGLVANQLYSQIELHRQYGGVVPELASRDHVRKLLPLVVAALEEAGLTRQDLSAIAYTQGPGLAGALLVGASFAKSLAFSLDVPAIAVHHLEAHLMAVMLEECQPDYPFITLLVSGGHTLLAEVSGFGCYRILGQSVDDAAGEAFDKTAKLLGLPYPGGPELAKLAAQGNPNAYPLPRPMLRESNFSFSGLKTAVRQVIHSTSQPVIEDVAASFQAAVVETLVTKSIRALQRENISRLVVAGGVSANCHLREQLIEQCQKNNMAVYFPKPAFCTDNGAMVAYAGWLRWQHQFLDADTSIEVRARWPLDAL